MNFADLVNGITQNFFGEASTYQYWDSSTADIKAVFTMSWLEVNSVSTYSLTAEIKAADLRRRPQKGDSIIRISDSRTFKIAETQPNADGSLFTLVLMDY